MEAVIKLYSLGYKQAKTYLAAALFTLGNMIVPQLCHTVHMGGPTWLPIYPKDICLSDARGGIGLSAIRNIGRMAVEGRFLYGITRFPYRHSGNAHTDFRWIFVC